MDTLLIIAIIGAVFMFFAPTKAGKTGSNQVQGNSPVHSYTFPLFWLLFLPSVVAFFSAPGIFQTASGLAQQA
jgi:hypothetical protein